MSIMENENLRALFERLCDQLHVQCAIGLEFPQMAVMVFVVDQQVMIYQFERQESLEYEELEPITADDCVDMVECLRDWEGGFADIFC